MIKTILYVHQSAELYGSDKTLFYLVRSVNIKPDFNVVVILPNDGPLKEVLEANNIEVVISPVLKLSRQMFTLKSILFFPFRVKKAIKSLNNSLNGQKIDIIHSNTLAVLIGAFYSKKYNIKHIWHIHEIIIKPKIVVEMLPFIVDWYSDIVVFNSKASKQFLCRRKKSLNEKSIIVLNGFDREEPITPHSKISEIRTNLFKSNNNETVLALVGRINRWKGHNLLLDVFARLKQKTLNLKLIFVGSAPPNQDYLAEELQASINSYGLQNDCLIIPFQKNIWNIWDSIDVAIVPSTEPEPFGLVAVEAMLAKKPVIAANHGGLSEIVVSEDTGYLFEPNNGNDLERCILNLLLSEKKLKKFAYNGHKRAINRFSLKSYTDAISELYEI